MKFPEVFRKLEVVTVPAIDVLAAVIAPELLTCPVELTVKLVVAVTVFEVVNEPSTVMLVFETVPVTFNTPPEATVRSPAPEMATDEVSVPATVIAG